MIRKAELSDIPRIAEMGEKFFAEAGWDEFEFIREDCEVSLEGMVANPLTILLVIEDEGKVVGMAGGVLGPLYFNSTRKMGEELFFYVEPSHRGNGGDLLLALEQTAKARGCIAWNMKALSKVRPEATGRLYERRGYRQSEITYIKRL